MPKTTVILIAGHEGMIDGTYSTIGKQSPIWSDGKQLFEGEFNRQIKYRVMELLHQAGIKYVDLVPEQGILSTDKRLKYSTRERKDREIRIQRLHDYYLTNKDCILIEIHANAGGGTGCEYFVASNASSTSKFIAQCFEDTYPLDIPWRGIKVRDWDIIYNAPMPSGLIENPFMDTEAECRKYLMTPQGRQIIANWHFQAIAKAVYRIG